MVRDPITAGKAGKPIRRPETLNLPRIPRNSAAPRQLGSGRPNALASARGFLKQVAAKPRRFLVTSARFRLANWLAGFPDADWSVGRDICPFGA
jgi:hypothetical protein